MSKKVRESTRSAALALLAPQVLDAAEDVGAAAHRYAAALAEVESAGEHYRTAWETAIKNGWKAEQLDQLPTVETRPPRKRSSAPVTRLSTGVAGPVAAEDAGEVSVDDPAHDGP